MHTRTAQRLSTAHRRHASNKYLQDLEAEIILAFAILPIPPLFESTINIQTNTYKQIPNQELLLSKDAYKLPSFESQKNV